jgi:opacity protein-like surface antigen
MIDRRSRVPRRTGRASACALLACALASPLATAANGGESERWQFEITPYLWGTGLDGSARINDRPQSGVAVEQSLSDILEILDFAAMGAFEARKGRWGALVDAVYFNVSDEGSVMGPLGFAALSATGAITRQMYSLMGAYRAMEGRTAVDLVGGLRYASVKWDVSFQASIPVLPAADRRFVETKGWVDPVIGARVQHALGDRWTLVGYADIGGFGAGSDLTWQLIAGVNDAFTPNVIGKVGYRYVSVDYDKGGFNYDMAFAGAYLGLGIRW